jgi:hypothetical protein
VFISHASEDKEAIARPLAEQLRAHGCTVWFDDYELVLGDSLRAKIGDGLRHSRVGVVILSHNFFAKRWPRWELDGLTARQLAGEENVILPVLHELAEADVRSYSPSLADLVAAKSSDGVEAVAESVVRVLTKRLAGGEPDAVLAEARRPPVAPVSRWRLIFRRATKRSGVRTTAALATVAAAGAVLIPVVLNEGQSAECKLRITAPTSGTKITNRHGTFLRGTACSNDLVWIFDYDGGDGRYYWVNRKPVDVLGEQWSQNDEWIGSKDHPVGRRYTIVATRVSRACSRALEAVRPDPMHNDVRFPHHPEGCRPRKSDADTQSVIVVKGR